MNKSNPLNGFNNEPFKNENHYKLYQDKVDETMGDTIDNWTKLYNRNTKMQLSINNE